MLQAFLLKSGMRKKCLPSTFLFDTGNLSQSNKAIGGKTRKGIGLQKNKQNKNILRQCDCVIEKNL